MTVPTISSPCVGCGMEKGHNILYCPTCTLVQRQEEANKISRGTQSNSGSDSGWEEVLGGIVGVLLILVAIIVWIFW